VETWSAWLFCSMITHSRVTRCRDKNRDSNRQSIQIKK
jgi:hypothetical protein